MSGCRSNGGWTWVSEKSGFLHHCNGETGMKIMIQSEIWIDLGVQYSHTHTHIHLWIGQLGLLGLRNLPDGSDWFHLESTPFQAHALDPSNRLWLFFLKLHEVLLWTRCKVVSVAYGGMIWEWKVDPVSIFMFSIHRCLVVKTVQMLVCFLLQIIVQIPCENNKIHAHSHSCGAVAVSP